MSVVEIIEDSENKLLARRELRVKFKAGNGILTRQAAAESIASKIGTKRDSVQVISLHGSSGVRDIDAKAYVFSDPKEAKKQLAEYVLLRHLSKDERKKIREERRKAATTPAPSAPAPAAQTSEKK